MKALRSTLALGVLAFAATASAADAPVSFSKDIAPIFVKNCQACHGPREAKGAYQLYNFELLMKPGESGDPAISAGKPEASYLYSLVAESDKDIRMPKDGDPLPAEQVALIKRWITEGAKYDAADPKATLASRNAIGWRRSTSSVVRVITGAAMRASATEPASPEKPPSGATRIS